MYRSSASNTHRRHDHCTLYALIPTYACVFLPFLTANEHLQQQFNGQVLREEQELYKSEGINWKHITFNDNQDVLDLLQGRRDQRLPGVFPTIDEHCRLPKATPKGLAESLKKDMKQNEKVSECIVESDFRSKFL